MPIDATRATFVLTNGVYLLADPAEATIAALPVAEGMRLPGTMAAASGFESVTIRRGSHTHVAFFRHLRQVLQAKYPRWAFCDVGGYIGAIGLPLARWIKDLPEADRAKVTIFEPTVLADFIARSIELNELGSVATVRREAASDRVGEVAFVSRPNQRVSGQIERPRAWSVLELKIFVATLLGKLKHEQRSTAHTVPLDQIYGGVRDSLLIIKIDTEGHEPQVLNGMPQTLANNPCVLILEFHASCLGQPVLGTTYENYLLENFMVFHVGNIGYPNTLTPIANAMQLKGSASRGKLALTDIVCFSRKLSNAEISAAVAPWLAKGPLAR